MCLDERSPTRRRVGRPRHLLQQQPAARPERALEDRDVTRILPLPHVLAHLDGGDGVERRGHIEIAVVLQPNLDAVAQTPLGGASDGEIALLGRQRDPAGANAITACRVQDQRAPTTPDVQQPHPRFELQLATDHVQLRGLRIVQRLALAGEIRRRVGHVVVEQ
jgi:hypothetical protein